MEKNKKNEDDLKAKAPLADKKQQLDSTVKGDKVKTDQKELGKLPDDELGTDHNSDPIIAKNQ